MLAFQKEPHTSRVSGLDEILLRVVSCELANNDTAARQYILEQDKPF